MTDYIDPRPTADRIIAEIERSGRASHPCLTVQHAEAVVHELKTRGYTAEAVERTVIAH